jgi:hypothetical protein
MHVHTTPTTVFLADFASGTQAFLKQVKSYIFSLFFFFVIINESSHADKVTLNLPPETGGAEGEEEKIKT